MMHMATRWLSNHLDTLTAALGIGQVAVLAQTAVVEDGIHPAAQVILALGITVSMVINAWRGRKRPPNDE